MFSVRGCQDTRALIRPYLKYENHSHSAAPRVSDIIFLTGQRALLARNWWTQIKVYKIPLTFDNYLKMRPMASRVQRKRETV